MNNIIVNKVEQKANEIISIVEADEPGIVHFLLTGRLPEKIVNAIKNIPEPYLNCDVEKLDVGYIDKLLRISFWAELENSEKHNRKFKTELIYKGICEHPTFYGILKNPKRLAFIIRPVDNHDIESKSLFLDGLKRYREIMAAPLYDKNGNFLSATANTIIKAVESLDQRLHGSPLQRIQKQSVHLNLDAANSNGPEDLKEKLAKLKQATLEKKMKNVGPSEES